MSEVDKQKTIKYWEERREGINVSGKVCNLEKNIWEEREILNKGNK